jgi:hypothetical protein
LKAAFERTMQTGAHTTEPFTVGEFDGLLTEYEGGPVTAIIEAKSFVTVSSILFVACI